MAFFPRFRSSVSQLWRYDMDRFKELGRAAAIAVALSGILLAACSSNNPPPPQQAQTTAAPPPPPAPTPAPARG